jgi:hypothetical protein
MAGWQESNWCQGQETDGWMTRVKLMSRSGNRWVIGKMIRPSHQFDSCHPAIFYMVLTSISLFLFNHLFSDLDINFFLVDFADFLFRLSIYVFIHVHISFQFTLLWLFNFCLLSLSKPKLKYMIKVDFYIHSLL